MFASLRKPAVSSENIQVNAAAMGEQSFIRMLTRHFLKHRIATAGFVIFVLIILMALFAPILAPQDPYKVTGSYGAAPSSAHLLGTDQIGRDILSRLIYASRVSVVIGLGSVAISVSIGTLLGLISGYFGKKLDMIIMRITDVFMSFSPLMLILVFVSVLGPSMTNVVLILGLLGWMAPARLVRGSVLSLKQMDYVKASVVLGLSTPRILFSHILPNAVAPILVYATFGIAAAITTEAALSFFGLGVQPPTASWGNMLTDAQSLTVLTSQPWQWIPPGLMIMIAVLSINFMGDGLRDAVDPKTLK